MMIGVNTCCTNWLDHQRPEFKILLLMLHQHWWLLEVCVVWKLDWHGGGYTSCRFPAINHKVLKRSGSDAHVVGELCAGHRLSRKRARSHLWRGGSPLRLLAVVRSPLERLGSLDRRWQDRQGAFFIVGVVWACASLVAAAEQRSRLVSPVHLFVFVLARATGFLTLAHLGRAVTSMVAHISRTHIQPSQLALSKRPYLVRQAILGTMEGLILL